MSRALALLLLLSLPAHAQSALDVRRATVELQDGSRLEVVEGCWLSTDRCLSAARELERLRAENESLRRPAAPSVVAASVVVALLLGAVGGYALARVGR